MFYDKQQAINACSEEPSLIFNLIKLGYFDVIEVLVDKNKVDANICDGNSNDVVTRLLKARQYELVLRLMKKRNWDVNHQNYDGDTFGHVLASDNSVGAVKIMEQLRKNKNYLPNIKNNKGETVLDKAVNNNYTFAAFKILEDKRFNNIDVSSFRKLCNAYLNNVSYYVNITNIKNKNTEGVHCYDRGYCIEEYDGLSNDGVTSKYYKVTTYININFPFP